MAPEEAETEAVRPGTTVGWAERAGDGACRPEAVVGPGSLGAAGSLAVWGASPVELVSCSAAEGSVSQALCASASCSGAERVGSTAGSG